MGRRVERDGCRRLIPLGGARAGDGLAGIQLVCGSWVRSSWADLVAPFASSWAGLGEVRFHSLYSVFLPLCLLRCGWCGWLFCRFVWGVNGVDPTLSLLTCNLFLFPGDLGCSRRILWASEAEAMVR
jgi:hypothetical protein